MSQKNKNIIKTNYHTNKAVLYICPLFGQYLALSLLMSSLIHYSSEKTNHKLLVLAPMYGCASLYKCKIFIFLYKYKIQYIPSTYVSFQLTHLIFPKMSIQYQSIKYTSFIFLIPLKQTNLTRVCTLSGLVGLLGWYSSSIGQSLSICTDLVQIYYDTIVSHYRLNPSCNNM